MTKQLTEQQFAAIEHLAKPKRGGLTIKEVADAVDVSERTLQRWRQDELFVKAVARRVMLASQDRLPELMTKAYDAFLVDGNAALLRVILQAQGLLTDKVEVKNENADGSKAVDMDDIRAKIDRMRREDNAQGDTVQ